jgi:hypothetical protein
VNLAVELGLATASVEHSSAFLGETLSAAKAMPALPPVTAASLFSSFPVHKSIYL